MTESTDYQNHMISPNVCILFWRTILACEHLLMGLKKTVPILSCSWCTSLHDHIEIWRNAKMLGLGFFFLGMGPTRVFLLLCGKEEWKTTTYSLHFHCTRGSKGLPMSIWIPVIHYT